MIKLLSSGRYKLIETVRQTKILYLGNEAFAWVEPRNIGEILVVTHKTHKTDCILSMGHFRLYDVVDEEHLSDQQHLELEVAPRCWQGYVLLSGLPDNNKRRGRIIPTHEIITGNPRFADRKELIGRSGGR